MPREIKTTIAVDGEAAFKRSINEAKTSIHNLGSEMTLATAQFKKDGDAKKLAESRNKALTSTIDQQKEIVRALEKAVEDSTKAFGANSAKTEKWEAELNRAKAYLVNLESELTLNNAGLDRNGRAFEENSEKAADYQATLKGIGKNISFETVTSGVGRITGAFETAFNKTVAFGKKLKETMQDAGQWADELLTSASEYGMDVETLQRWRNAADLVDTPVEKIITSRDKLARKMKDGWTEGTGDDKMDLWQFFGVDLKGDDGKFRDAMDVFWEMGETFMNMEKIDGNDIRVTDYAMELFGKSWRELRPLFVAGREEWEKTVAEQEVVSEANVKALGAMDDSFNNLENSWETAKYSVLAQMAPLMSEVADALARLLNEFNAWLETDEGKQAMSELADALRELFSGITDIKLSDAMDVAKKAIDALKDGLIWLKDNKDAVYDALKVIASGFGLLKVSELVLKFLMLKNGLSGLLGFGKGGGSGAATATDAAAAAGGFGTGLRNAMTSATTKASSFIVSQGALPDVVMDMFLNQTNAGRALRDGLGLSGAWEGLKTDIKEKRDEIAYNASTFQENWDPNSENANVLAKLFGRIDTALNGGYNKIYGTDGRGGTLDAMTPEMWAAAARYFGYYRNEESWGTEEAFAAREDLLSLFEQTGMYNPEGAVDMLENVFRNYLDENDPDGLVNRVLLSHPEVFGLGAAVAGGGGGGALASWIQGDTIASALQDTVFNIGRGAGQQLAVIDGTNLPSSGDLKEFRGLPGEMQERVQIGVQRGISGIRVTLDGAAVGRLVSQYVNEYLGQQVQ